MLHMKKKLLKKQKSKTKNKKIIFKSFKNIKRHKKFEKIIYTLKFFEKLGIILMLIALYVYQSLNGIPIEQIQAKVLPEIKSFENSINLNQQIFNEFRKINSENKLIEENPNFKKSVDPDITVVMTMYNQEVFKIKVLKI